jgi:hypothetical protein
VKAGVGHLAAGDNATSHVILSEITLRDVADTDHFDDPIGLKSSEQNTMRQF